MVVSWLDGIVALYLALHLVTGYQQGLFLGGLGLAAFVGAAGLGIGLAPVLSGWLGGPPVVHALVVGAIAFALLKVAQGGLVNRLGPRLAERPRLQRVDRWLGLLPGLAWGALGAGVVAWFVSAFAGGLPAHSPLAGTLYAAVHEPLAALGRAIPEGREAPPPPVGGPR